MTFQLVRVKKYLFSFLGCKWYVMESAVCFGAYYLTVTGKSLKKLMPEKSELTLRRFKGTIKIREMQEEVSNKAFNLLHLPC